MGAFCLHSLHVVEKLAVATPMKEVKLIGLRKPGFKYRGVHHSIVFFLEFHVCQGSETNERNFDQFIEKSASGKTFYLRFPHED